MNYARKQGITKKVIREKRLLWPRLARSQKSAEPKACKRDKGSRSSLHGLVGGAADLLLLRRRRQAGQCMGDLPETHTAHTSVIVAMDATSQG